MRHGEDFFRTILCPWKDDARAAVSLTLDGAYQGTFERATEILSRYEMPATWFVVTGAVGDELEGRPVVSWEKLRQASQTGMEIASHTVTHPDLALSWPWLFRRYIRPRCKRAYRLFTPAGMQRAIFLRSVLTQLSRGASREKVLAEAVDSKRAIERATGVPVVSFAYPGGRYDPWIAARLKESGYLSARSVDPGCNALESLNLFALKSRVWDIQVEPPKTNRWVDEALEKGGWLIETYHVISESGNTGYYWDTPVSELDAHFSYIRSLDLWVDTQERVTKYLLERINTRVSLRAVAGNEVHLHPECPLDPDLFDQPLTLKTKVPYGWEKVGITQNGHHQTVETRREDNGRVVIYNILPHDGRVTLTPLEH
jgi:peptidoglycan/xylan/chitin deacetylase (PgdA/CDA1 family)